MKTLLSGWPISTKYWRASFSAASIASEPPLTKYAWVVPAGAVGVHPLPALVAELRAEVVLLAAGDAPCRVRRGRNLLELDHDPPRPLLVRRLHDPDLGIGMGKWDLAQSALGVLVEHACFDTGLRQPMQEQICLGQVRGGAQPEHERVIEPAR